MTIRLPLRSTRFEKSPLSISGVGTLANVPLALCLLTKPSYEAKKNVRFRPLYPGRTIGPPSDPPKLFCL